MILTVLEARIAPERSADLQDGYRALAARTRPAGLISSQLLRASADPELWRIETVWRDRQALDAMRTQGVPAGVVLFREAGTEPTLSLFEVVDTLATR